MSSKCRIVIQSRMTSSRLPGKAMMNVRGYPSVVLCALRAANSGIPVTVATSTDISDDIIDTTLRSAGVDVYRGELNDVLARYVAATSDMNDEHFIARYTADNMFPDGSMISLLMGTHATNDYDSVVFDEGLPYGMGAGVVRVKWLRRAHATTQDPYDREHVTPWVERNCPPKLIPNPCIPKFGDLSHLRCTMDSLSDYVRVCRAFEAVGGDPVTASWEDLVQALRDLPDSPKHTNPKTTVHGRPNGVLQLGTAQLGSDYGISNREGQPTEQKATEMLRMAIDAGVETVDTARDYGNSESRIGRLVPAGDASRLRVVTKLGGLAELSKDAGAIEVRHAVDASVFRSCRELRLNKIPVLLLHRSSHLSAWSGAAWTRLLELQEEGVVGELGVSIYSPDELVGLTSFPQIRHLQLPFNLLDRRWLAEQAQSEIQSLLTTNTIEITVRSVLLQGLLHLPAAEWPSFPGVDADAFTSGLKTAVNELDREDIVDLCIAYVRAYPWVHSVVIGAESTDQLRRNLRYVNRAPLTVEQRKYVESTISAGPDYLVNPSRWSEVISAN